MLSISALLTHSPSRSQWNCELWFPFVSVAAWQSQSVLCSYMNCTRINIPSVVIWISYDLNKWCSFRQGFLRASLTEVAASADTMHFDYLLGISLSNCVCGPIIVLTILAFFHTVHINHCSTEFQNIVYLIYPETLRCDNLCSAWSFTHATLTDKTSTSLKRKPRCPSFSVVSVRFDTSFSESPNFHTVRHVPSNYDLDKRTARSTVRSSP